MANFIYPSHSCSESHDQPVVGRYRRHRWSGILCIYLNIVGSLYGLSVSLTSLLAYLPMFERGASSSKYIKIGKHKYRSEIWYWQQQIHWNTNTRKMHDFKTGTVVVYLYIDGHISNIKRKSALWLTDGLRVILFLYNILKLRSEG